MIFAFASPAFAGPPAQFATQAKPQYLPKQQPTDRQVFSVPTLEGRYAYYESDQPTPARNDDYPVVSAQHPNPIGIASTAIGREMPRNARFVGTGEQAIGSVTAMPGQAAPLGRGTRPASGPSADGIGRTDGLGALGEFDPMNAGLVLGAVAAVVAFFVIYDRMAKGEAGARMAIARRAYSRNRRRR